MKTKVFVALLLITLGVALHAQMQNSPGWSSGFEVGIAHGDNAGKAENLAPMGRGHIQLEIFPFLFTRIGLGFTPPYTPPKDPRKVIAQPR